MPALRSRIFYSLRGVHSVQQLYCRIRPAKLRFQLVQLVRCRNLPSEQRISQLYFVHPRYLLLINGHVGSDDLPRGELLR